MKIGVDGASVRSVDAAAGSVLRLADAERELKAKVDDAARSMAAMNSAGVGPRSTVAERLAAFTPPGVPTAAGPLPTAPRLPVAQRLPFDPGPGVGGRPVGPTPGTVDRDAVGRVVADRTRLADEAGRVEAAAHDRVRAALEQRLRMERELLSMRTERARLAGGFAPGESHGFGFGGQYQYGGANRTYAPGTDGGGHRWDRGIRELTERFSGVLDRHSARGPSAVERYAGTTRANIVAGGGATGFGGGNGWGFGNGGIGPGRPASAAAGVGAGVGSMLGTAARYVPAAAAFAGDLGAIEKQGYMTEQHRREQEMRAIPVFGHGYGLGLGATRYLTGQDRAMRGVNEARGPDMIAMEAAVEMDRLRGTYGVQERTAFDKRNIYADYRTPRMPSTNRAGVAARRGYEEQERLLPAREGLARSEAGQMEASAKLGRMLQEGERLKGREKSSLDKLKETERDLKKARLPTAE